jgi:DNA topoisomerase-3
MPPGSDMVGRNGGDGWVDMVITSVRGHLMHHDFPDTYKSWRSPHPSALFTAPIVTRVSDDAKNIEKNLLAEARGSGVLMIWTDCDREGEHIGAEIVKICKRANPTIKVKRAKFSAIIAK